MIVNPIKRDLPSQSSSKVPKYKFKLRGVEFELWPDISGEILVGRYSCGMCLRTVIYAWVRSAA